MDSQKFLNKYINALAEQVKTLTMEKTMLVTQLALAQEEIEELKAQVPQPAPSDSGNTTWHQ
jgi:uncharacterized protein YnzC (UPF0291/DUF896 family)